MYTPALHNIYGHAQTHTHTHTHTRACTHAHTNVCNTHTGTHCIRRPYLSVKIGLEWSIMASNATLSHLKTQIFPGGGGGGGGGGGMPQTPLVSYVYIYPCTPYTYLQCSIHLYYHCTACVLEMSRIPHIHTCTCPPTILCKYPPPPPPSPCYIHTIHTPNLCVYLARQSFTVILKPASPPKF